jgi:hypothetical protein
MSIATRYASPLLVLGAIWGLVQFGVAARADSVSIARAQVRFYRYFDRSTAHDYKGYSVGPSPVSGEIELVLCGGGEKKKFTVEQLKPDDGPCNGSSPGPWGYAYIIYGRVLGVGNDIVTLSMQTDAGAGETTTLPKKLFKDSETGLNPGDSVMFIANQNLWGKPSEVVSTAFGSWKAKAGSPHREYAVEFSPLVTRDLRQ